MNKNVSTGDPQEYGGLFIILDQDTYLPGQTATGSVFLELKKHYPGTVIILQILGQENTRWTIRPSHFPTQRAKVIKDQSIIINHQQILHVWKQGGIVPLGQYSFPFSFLIPEGLPGSCESRVGNAFGKITYELTAYLKPTEQVTPELRYIREIILREPICIQVKSENSEKSHIHKLCGCFNQGSTALKATTKKNLFKPGEEIEVTTEIDNNLSHIPISSTKVYLQQTLSLTANKHTTIAKERILEIEIGKIDRLSSENKSIKFKVPPIAESIPASLLEDNSYKEKETDTSTITELMNTNTNSNKLIVPTSIGKIVKCEYFIILKAQMEGTHCGIINPKVRIPIQIYAGDLKVSNDKIQPPVNWSPYQMKNVNFALEFNQLSYKNPNDLAKNLSTHMASSFTSNTEF